MDSLFLLLALFTLALGLALIAHRVFPARLRRPLKAFARHQHVVECNTPVLDRPEGFVVRAELEAGQEVRLIQSRRFANGADTRLWHEVELEPGSLRGWVREDVLVASSALFPDDELVDEPLIEEPARQE